MNAFDLVPRKMLDDDIPWVMQMEIESYPFPWTEGIFRDCLKVGYQCWVFEWNAAAVGYAILSVAVGEAHLLNLCVKPSEQRKGIGKDILRYLVERAMAHKAENLFLEVRESNRTAINLYHAEGFHQIGIRVGYYPAKKGKEDAIVMAKPLAFSS